MNIKIDLEHIRTCKNCGIIFDYDYLKQSKEILVDSVVKIYRICPVCNTRLSEYDLSIGDN